MSIEYTKKGKIGISIIAIWIIVSAILAFSGIGLMALNMQGTPTTNIDQLTIYYCIAIIGMASLMFGTMIIFGFRGFDSHSDWYEWKEEG